jgi:hypothetical protein
MGHGICRSGEAMRNEAGHKQKKRSRRALLTAKHISVRAPGSVTACLPASASLSAFDKTQRKTSTRPRISSVPAPDYDKYVH